MLANNVVELSYGELLGRLRYDQAAPPGFMVLEKALVDLVGLHEHALRVVPLAAGLATVPLAAWLAHRLLGATAALTVAATLALSPGLVRFSTEVKQYAVDAAAVVAVIAALAWWSARPASTRRWAAVVGAAAVLPWFSYTAVFAAAGAGAYVLHRAVAGGGGVGRRQLAGAAVVGASLVVLFAVNVRHVRGNEFLATYWRAGFPPSSGPAAVVCWLPSAWHDAMRDPVRADAPALVAVLAVVGAVALVARHRSGIAVAGTAAAGVGAAVAQVYPLENRVALWAVPLVAVLVVAGPTGLRRRAAPAVVLAAVPLLLPGLRAAPGHVLDPLEIAQGREAYEFVAARWREGDLLVAHSTAAPVVRFYEHALAGPAAEAESQWHPGVACDAPAPPPQAPRRVWVLYAYTLSSRPPDDARRVHDRFGGRRTAVAWFEGVDASAAAYPVMPPPAAAPPGARECLVAVATDGAWRVPLG